MDTKKKQADGETQEFDFLKKNVTRKKYHKQMHCIADIINFLLLLA